MILTFGKYKGLSIQEIARIDSNYVFWIYDKKMTKEITKESKKQLVILTKEIILNLRINKVVDLSQFDINSRWLIRHIADNNLELYGKDVFRVINRSSYRVFSRHLPSEIGSFFYANPDCTSTVSLAPIAYERRVLFEKYLIEFDLPF